MAGVVRDVDVAVVTDLEEEREGEGGGHSKRLLTVKTNLAVQWE